MLNCIDDLNFTINKNIVKFFIILPPCNRFYLVYVYTNGFHKDRKLGLSIRTGFLSGPFVQYLLGGVLLQSDYVICLQEFTDGV